MTVCVHVASVHDYRAYKQLCPVQLRCADLLLLQ
jgi:hypothetical protein